MNSLIQEKRAKRAAGEDEKAPLTGLVWCACGQKMLVPTGSAKFSCVKCSTQISAADLEAIFAADFADVVATHPALAGAMEGPSERREWMAEIAGLDGELAGAIRQWAGVERMFTEAAISQTRFEELHAPLESKVRGLESKLVGLRKSWLRTRQSRPS